MHIQVVQEQLVTLWQGGPRLPLCPCRGGSPVLPERGSDVSPGTAGAALSPCGLYLMGTSLPALPGKGQGFGSSAAPGQDSDSR